jgi:isopentenyl-diphosphate Delta-isomerase
MALDSSIKADLILVDEQDRPVGTCEKMEAHVKGFLHRAFSVFIFDSQGRMLLQQRALGKYHSGGLWTNACCSHPYPEEDTLAAGVRRLREEMGFVTPLTKAFDFIYRAELDNGLTEHEFDHVLVGEYEGPMELNPEEVMAAEYVSISEIENRLAVAGDQYTVWFKIAFPIIMSHIKDKK